MLLGAAGSALDWISIWSCWIQLRKRRTLIPRTVPEAVPLVSRSNTVDDERGTNLSVCLVQSPGRWRHIIMLKIVDSERFLVVAGTCAYTLAVTAAPPSGISSVAASDAGGASSLLPAFMAAMALRPAVSHATSQKMTRIAKE